MDDTTDRFVNFFNRFRQFAYAQAQETRIEQVVDVCQSVFQFVVSHKPVFLESFYEAMIKSDIVSSFLCPVVLYRFVMFIFRFMFRLIYGFIKFSMVGLLLCGALYIIHLQIMTAE